MAALRSPFEILIYMGKLRFQPASQALLLNSPIRTTKPHKFIPRSVRIVQWPRYARRLKSFSNIFNESAPVMIFKFLHIIFWPRPPIHVIIISRYNLNFSVSRPFNLERHRGSGLRLYLFLFWRWSRRSQRGLPRCCSELLSKACPEFHQRGSPRCGHASIRQKRKRMPPQPLAESRFTVETNDFLRRLIPDIIYLDCGFHSHGSACCHPHFALVKLNSEIGEFIENGIVEFGHDRTVYPGSGEFAIQ